MDSDEKRISNVRVRVNKLTGFLFGGVDGVDVFLSNDVCVCVQYACVRVCVCN